MTENPTTTDTTEDDTVTEEPPQVADAGELDQHDDAAERLAEVTTERDALALQVARLTVAAETGVPADLLRGDTADELRAHAQALRTFAGSRIPAAPPPTPLTPPPPSTDPLRDILRP